MNTNDVRSARRLLTILQYFAQTRTPASLSQVSTALDIPKSDCMALFDALEEEGYAHQSGGRYYLTRRWFDEASAIAEHDQLTERVRPVLDTLRENLRETLILAQRSGDQVVYLQVAEPERIVRFTARPGERKPLHAAASGRALLHAMAPAEREALIERLRLVRYTERTPATREQLRKALQDGIARGYHVNFGEHQPDTLSVAVPVVLFDTPYALAVGAPLERAKPQVEEIGKLLREAARELGGGENAAQP
ncbi:IclR family transcriptional regulator [Pigmentiphaga sp.]|uniref:IclR family transcriptional regulator n=1 Tax=Pigmentiphaga sp. TaxID=1977564 RepID=UPI0025E04237|nr:IclR family transcriptional regulator [Pigmentiphaga sp.]MBX6317584.1 IclR family transcriptional regulator [Pigmentiphaga sp.]